MNVLKEHINVVLMETVRIQRDHIYVIVEEDMKHHHGILEYA